MSDMPMWLLVAHFVGDFVLQSDEMAIKKSKDWNWLGVHVLAYMSAFAVPFFIVGIVRDNTPHEIGAVLAFLVVTTIAHFVTDAITSRITGRFWFFKQEFGIWTQAEYAYPKHGMQLVNPWMPIAGKRHWFFVMIGFDQLLHFAQLALTYHWLIR